MVPVTVWVWRGHIRTEISIKTLYWISTLAATMMMVRRRRWEMGGGKWEAGNTFKGGNLGTWLQPFQGTTFHNNCDEFLEKWSTVSRRYNHIFQLFSCRRKKGVKVIPCFKHKGSLGELKIAHHFCKNLVQFRGQLRGKWRFVKMFRILKIV